MKLANTPNISSFEELTTALRHIEEEAAKLPPEWRGPVLEVIRTRRKWSRIIREYPVMKDQFGSEIAHRKLAEKYNFTKSNIQKIIYELNPTQKVCNK